MNYLYENVAYLRGLADGLEIEDKKSGKLLSAMIDVLDDMAEAINALNEDVDSLDEYVDVLDEDLSELEDDFYDEDTSDSYYDLICPECGELFYVDDATLFDPVYGASEVSCPVCDAKIDLSECDCCAEYDDLYEDDDDYIVDQLDAVDDTDVADKEDEVKF